MGKREIIASEEELYRRLIACLAQLPKICVCKACRRRKKCWGPNVICLQHHWGLVEERCGGLWRRPGHRPGDTKLHEWGRVIAASMQRK